mmetsp:Transcript_40621/g.29918  ORF Transcript_40621/g.29918 Transcript_40621/m.29918 type:complete len:89 (+) Transcript_40621:490-756(+)
MFQVTKAIKTLLAESLHSRLKAFLFEFKLIFAIYLVYLSAVLIIFRTQLVKSLCEKIFQSRGILNLIPEEHFEENREKFEEVLKILKD